MTNYRGIDYAGPNSTVNRDAATGIRYGVISCNSVNPDVLYDAQELDYGTPTCGHCGGDAIAIPAHGEQLATGGVAVIVGMPDAYADYERSRGACGDYACEHCEILFDADEAFSEACGWSIDDNGCHVINCLDNDAMIVKSPYFTHAQFCSPCVPGACSLDSPCVDGERAYCLGHEWFDGDIAPYPVFSVETGALVEPSQEVQS